MLVGAGGSQRSETSQIARMSETLKDTRLTTLDSILKTEGCILTNNQYMLIEKIFKNLYKEFSKLPISKV